MVRVILKKVSRALMPTRIPGADYALNPYHGCAHGCLYCYARSYLKELNPYKWGNVVIVKQNIIRLLRKEINKYRPKKVFIGTITDPYQPVEAIYKITRRSLELLLTKGIRVSIQTKNPLILRDIDIISRYRNLVDVGITLTTLNYKISKVYEPFAPPPEARIRALERLSGLGVRTWIFVGPIIPNVTDLNTIERILTIAKKTDSLVIFDKFRVKDFMLSKECKIEEIALRSLRFNWEDLFTKIKDLCVNMNVECKRAFSLNLA
jgi:DNA repair photolyase